MKSIRFFAASLAASALSLTAGGLSLACDQCQARTPCHACGTSDDGGLLDGLDRVAQRLQPRLSRLAMPRLPALDTTLRLALRGRVGCDGSATCGCELNEATCGCELKEPTCGCESPESCDCQTHAGNSYHRASQPVHQDSTPRYRSSPSQGQPPYSPSTSQPEVPLAAPTPIPQPAPHVKPHAPRQPSVPRINDYQPAPRIERQPLNPVQPRVPDMVPLPDKEVDPFRDDAAIRVRRIPSRTIQYRQPTPAYRQNYDPQASHDGFRQRLTDDMPPASPRLAFDEESSSRTRASQTAIPSSTAELRQPEVVTASVESQRHSSASHYQPRASTTARPMEIRNPLRDH